MTDKRQTPQPCSICQSFIWPRNGWSRGNNARPINDGRCCDDCNMNVEIATHVESESGGEQMIFKPTVHLNGTSRDALLESYCEAINALHEAGRKLAAAYPNARDYYVQGDEATAGAMKQHEARLAKLKEVIGELEEIAEHIR